MVRGYNHARLGFGVHSLRAVTTSDIFHTVENGPKDLPFHVHAAEQIREVEECKAFLDRRPVEWLLDNLPLTGRFNLVHCTHLTEDELVRLAKSRANVVLCPSTEGNLGDGIFRLREFANHYGNWCIGTDSQINLNPLEDVDPAKAPSHHTPDFMMDESGMITGVKSMLGITLEYMFLKK